MCHNSGIENQQIDRFVANGMPKKIIKSVKYTMRKRLEEEQKRRAALANTAKPPKPATTKIAETIMTAAVGTAETVETTETAVAVATTITTATIMETATVSEIKAKVNAGADVTGRSVDEMAMRTTIENITNAATTTKRTVARATNKLYSDNNNENIIDDLDILSHSQSQSQSQTHTQTQLQLQSQSQSLSPSQSQSQSPSPSLLSSPSSSPSLAPPSSQLTSSSFPSLLSLCKTSCKPNTIIKTSTATVTATATPTETVIKTATATTGVAEKITKKNMQETTTAATIAEPMNEKKSPMKIPKLCGRFRQQQQQQQQQHQQHQQQQQSSLDQQQQQKDMSQQSSIVSEPSLDALAISTQITRKFVQRLNQTVGKLQRSKLYTVLTRTTQPAHLIAICILSFVLLTVGPELIDNGGQVVVATATATPTTTTTTSAAAAAAAVAGTIGSAVDTTAKMKEAIDTNTSSCTSSGNSNGSNGAATVLATIAYLGAFATHFGAQIWMTFVSGLSLYFSLPRHTFGQCQQILFPKYFALNAMLSILMLIIYVKYFLSVWTIANCIQLLALALTAAIEVTVRLYLAPPMLRLMHEKYKIEDAIGSGQEVGSLVQGDLVQCPHYQRIHKAFRRIHMTVAMGNMTILLATCMQLYFLAMKIQIN